jgi:outer membrane protein, heavy metal efflux system
MIRILAIALILMPSVALRLAAQSHEQTSQMQMPGQQALEPLKEAAKRPPMRLKDFEAMALDHNPTLKQAADLVQRSSGQVRQAGLYPNPSAGYEGSELRGGSFGGGENGAFLQQTIVLGGKLGLRKRVFNEQRREDELGVTEQRVRVLSDVDQKFYAALAAQEIIMLRRHLEKVAQDAVETVHQLANVGQADTPDVLQTEVEAGQSRVDALTAQMDYIEAFHTLAASAGNSDLPLAPLEGTLEAWPKLNPQQILSEIVRDSPQVKRAEQAVARAEAELQSAKHEAIPDLRLRAGLQQDSEVLNEAAVRSKAVGVIGFATAGISIPVFNRNQGNLAAASADLNRARQEVDRVRLSLRQRAARLVEEYWASEVEARQYKTEIIPKAARAYQLYLNKYRQMASAYPQVIISQRTLSQLEVSYVEALDRLWASAVALENFTLTGGLDAPAASGASSTTINLPNGGPGFAE